ncbi:Y4oB family protein [Sphingomonas parva]|nr:Y4oB family protein [Sphingomonas parva]
MDELEQWLATQKLPPTLLDLVETGNGHLLAAFILKGFREATARAVEERDRVAWVRGEITDGYAGDAERAEKFLRAPHPLLGGEPPLRKALRSDQDAEEVIALARLDVVGPAMRVLDGIAEAWRLTRAEEAELLGVDRHTLRHWRSSPPARLPAEALERLSLALGIFKAINSLLPVPDRADAWIRKANTAQIFGGGSALELMLTGLEGLRSVRRYLDAQI